MPLKTVALVAALCLTTGWMLASLLSPPVATVQALPDRRAARQPATEDATPQEYTQLLKLRLQQQPSAPTPRRNPFLFGTRDRVDAPAASPSRERGEPAPPMITNAPPPPPLGPIFSLSGMAVAQTEAGPVHTAVLSDGRSVHLVKKGDAIAGYKVIEITDSSVTLAESSGERHVIRLKP